MTDLNTFREWVQAKPRRSVTIELGSPADNMTVEIKAYDYNTQTLQKVSSVEEIDLETMARENELKQLEALKAKYES